MLVTIDSGSGGGHLNTRIDEPRTTPHQNVVGIVVQQGSTDNAVGLFLHASGFSIKSNIAILKPGLRHF